MFEYDCDIEEDPELFENYEMVFRVDKETLILQLRDFVVECNVVQYLSSDDWSCDYYRTQARLGFIATSRFMDDAWYLLPQLQFTYSVLDFENLGLDRGLRKIFREGRIEREQITLRIDSSPDRVLPHLLEKWGSESWLSPLYCDLMRRLAEPEEADNAQDFRLWAVTLEHGSNKAVAAGELGYTLGNTYTSLSGFSYRRPEWNHFGKLQMLLLGRWLDSCGISFWNLGHANMDYKIRLGSRDISRQDFLKRWDRAVEIPAPDICLAPEKTGVEHEF